MMVIDLVHSPHAVSYYAEDRGSVNLDPCYKLYPADKNARGADNDSDITSSIVALYRLKRQLIAIII